MESLRVVLLDKAGDRSYPIHIGAGILGEAALLAPYLGGGTAAIITNPVVAPHYLARVKVALEKSDARVVEIVVEDGEQAKSWQTLNRVFDALLKARCGRDTLIVALGGGVVGDLAGFAAATYQRGVAFVQLPTTLLAQVDSSVGGKTAINHVLGKNMIGAFHQPAAVLADVSTLDTLPSRELRAGIAEVIKHGLALDAAFVDWLEKNMAKILKRDGEALIYAVRRSCELKARVVAADEREAGERALLNFGHTFGHAIETGSGYGTWLHGEAVAAGMVMAAELSLLMGQLKKTEVSRVRDLLLQAGLPVKGPALAPERMLELMSIDKKASKGKARFVVLESIGRAALRGGIAEDLVRKAIVAAAQ
jgi:3-dehydroquinate synthase